MNNMKKWVRGALCVGACAGLMYVLAPFAADQEAGPGKGAAAGIATTQASGGMPGQAQPGNTWLGTTPPGGPAVVESPLSTMSPPQFAADGRGKLVLNGDTHANLEKLLLEEDPDKMRANLERVSGTLPAQAAAELKVLVGQFQQYSKALPHTIPPDHAPETEQESLTLLDRLHALRVSYLGPEATQAMFGAEEATTRQLIALMAAEKYPNLTPQEKAERAQELLRKQPAPAS
jgi:hypothetical protein